MLTCAILIPIVCSIVCIDCALQYRTGLAIKRRVNAFAIGAANYTELVKKSKIFVDTSLFIEQVLRDQHYPKPVMVMAPEKWGKTINGDMLKTFLEIQVDERGYEKLPKESTSNYRLFKKGEVVMEDGTVQELERPLLISNNTKLMEKYQGQMPVIYIDLKHMKGDLWEDLLMGLYKSYREAWRQHDYLLKVYNETMESTTDFMQNLTAKYYRNVFLEKLNEENTDMPEEVIVFLSKILTEHFNRTPFIIIDHFDKTLFEKYRTNNFTRSNMDHNSYLSDRLGKIVFRHNEYCCGGLILTGMHVHRGWTMNNYTIKDTLCATDGYTEYFGINEKDAATLFDQYGIVGHKAQMAHKWYRGYESSPQGEHPVYNPVSVANFINTKKFTTYWNQSTPDNVIKATYEKRTKARLDLLSLLSKRTIRVRGDFNVIYLRLLDLAHFDEPDWRRDFFWYLARMGYLRVSNFNATVEDEKLTVQILNNEMAQHVSHWLVSYYQRKYNISDVHLNDTANIMLSFVNDQPSTLQALEWFLTDLYKRSVYPDKVPRTELERPAHAVFLCVVLKMQSLSLFDIDVHYNKKSFARYVIANNRTRQGFVVEVRHPSDKHKIPKEDLKYAVEYQKAIVEQLTHLNSVKSVVADILDDNVVRLSETIVSRR